jgi:hypothetical protein
MEHEITREYITEEFVLHREWMVDEYFRLYLLRSMMMMTEQLTVVAMQQVEIIGAFLDAKHQLETQRLFQQLQARAYKDYHPSEMMCTFGTNVRAMGASERMAEFNARALAEQSLSRQLLEGDRSSSRGRPGDRVDRLEKFRTTYCDPADNARGLEIMCGGGGPAERRNRDINYTRLVDDALTLNVNFTDPATPPDEEDVIALQNYLFGHDVFTTIQPTYLDRLANQEIYLDARSIIAKRSVLANSYNHQVGLRSQGSGGSDAFLRAIMEELGADPLEIERLGDNVSYYAQLRTMVKQIQSPQFFTKLYDTPANVDRLGVALRALGIQIDYQMLKSKWRLEMIMAIDGELELMRVQEDVQNELARLRGDTPEGELEVYMP